MNFVKKWYFENVIFVKNENLKMWISWKMRFWKCEFCEKWDFENVNFVKNVILKLWFFGKTCIFAPVCVGKKLTFTIRVTKVCVITFMACGMSFVSSTAFVTLVSSHMLFASTDSVNVAIKAIWTQSIAQTGLATWKAIVCVFAMITFDSFDVFKARTLSRVHANLTKGTLYRTSCAVTAAAPGSAARATGTSTRRTSTEESWSWWNEETILKLWREQYFYMN